MSAKSYAGPAPWAKTPLNMSQLKGSNSWDLSSGWHKPRQKGWTKDTPYTYKKLISPDGTVHKHRYYEVKDYRGFSAHEEGSAKADEALAAAEYAFSQEGHNNVFETDGCGHIAHLKYAQDSNILEVTFENGSKTVYSSIPDEVCFTLLYYAATKVTATYNVAKKLVITLMANGKALANKKVTVKVGTISKTLTTNAKGQVSLNVATLVPKTYTATVKFAGDEGYLASSLSPKVVVSKAKPQIVAKAKTFKVKVKTKKYTVTLKNNKGKVMKKVKLTLKVGKKTYKATTNSKGKATFKITKLTKKGKYTATIKFAGSKYYKALSKKVKITVKK